jgi:hypothetical protein
VLSMLLLFHLSLTTGDFACASHANHLGHGGRAAAEHVGMQMSVPSTPPSNAAPTVLGEAHEQCPTPITPACCTAMVSCSAVCVAGAAPDEFGPTLTTVNPCPDLAIATVRATGPDTPPPRA